MKAKMCQPAKETFWGALVQYLEHSELAENTCNGLLYDKINYKK